MADLETELGAVLGAASAPRRLSPSLAARLEAALLDGRVAGTTDPDDVAEGRPLAEGLSGRIEDVLADPVAGALADVDGPRPLRPEAERALARALGPRPRRVVAPVAVAAAVAVLAAGAGVALVLSSRRAAPPGVSALAPGPSSTTHRAPGASAGAAAGGAAAGGAADGGPAAGGVAAPPAAASGAASAPLGAGLPQAGTPVAPVPLVSSVSPASGPDGGGTWVTVTGTGLGSATAVDFGEVLVPATVVSDTVLRVQAPPHATGVVDIRVVMSDTTSAPVAADRFTYTG